MKGGVIGEHHSAPPTPTTHAHICRLLVTALKLELFSQHIFFQIAQRSKRANSIHELFLPDL